MNFKPTIIKLAISILLGIFLIGIVSAVDCIDSDEGKNYDVAGNVQIGENTYWDECMSDKFLDKKDSDDVYEYFCDDVSFNTEMYTCQYGCDEGACSPPGFFRRILNWFGRLFG